MATATARSPQAQTTAQGASSRPAEVVTGTAAVAAIVAILASSTPPATMAALVASALSVYGVSPTIAKVALATVLKGAVTPQMPPGPAATAMAYMQATFRAAYLANAALRMQAAANDGADLQQTIANEMRFLRLHIAAQRNRGRAAMAVDQAAGGDGEALLLWVAKMDSRTSAECAAANGHTFTASSIPIIGYPGAVHPHCRCRAERAPIDAYGISHVDTVMSPALMGAH